MHLRVGSFVFSQGVVSAVQLIKDPAYLTSPVMSKFIRVTGKSLQIIVLGLIRVILIKGTDNFFSRLTYRTFYGLRHTTPLSCFFTSDVICGFSL